MTTALGSKDMIMEAIGRGAYDYFVSRSRWRKWKSS